MPQSNVPKLMASFMVIGACLVSATGVPGDKIYESQWISLVYSVLGSLVVAIILLFVIRKSVKRFLSRYFVPAIHSSYQRFLPVPGVKRLKDIALPESTLKQMVALIDYMSRPDDYTRFGAKIPQSIAFIGPPHSGKRLGARVVAGESRAEFFNVTLSDLGTGEERYKRIHEYFNSARGYSGAVIFLNNAEIIKCDNQLFCRIQSEISKIRTDLSVSCRIVVIWSFRKWPRKDCFDDYVVFEEPDKSQISEIIKIHSKRISFPPSLDACKLSKILIDAIPLIRASHVATFVNEIALSAARMRRMSITRADVDYAIGRVADRFGLDKNRKEP